MIGRLLKQRLAMILALIMLIAVLPLGALAEDGGGLRASLDPGVTGLSASYDSGTWSANSTAHSITGSVTTTSSGCSGTNYTVSSGTLTLTNTSGAAATLSFTAAPATNGGTVRINGEDAAPKAYSFVLQANGTVTVAISSNPNDESTTSVVLSDIALISQKNVTITFVPAENGSYTVDGTAVTSQITITRSSTELFNLAATPAQGFVFAGWIKNGDQSAVLGSDAVTALSFTDDMTVTAYFIDDSVAVFDVSGKQFYSLTAAVNYAQANSKSKITLVRNGTLPAGDYSIPSGITLLVPFDDAGTVYTSTPAIVYGSHTTPTAFRTLKMAPGANITVQNGGALCVSGKLSSSGQMGGWNGTPTGPDGRIEMSGNSSITVKSGANLYCWGYIYGAGSVSAESGSTVYEAFQIKDWRGGTATSNVYKYAFIFNQYYVQNIEVPLTIYAGATEKLYSSVNASSSAYPMSATFIGSGGLFSISSGYIVKDYKEAEDRLRVDVYGNVSVSPMTLSGLPVIGSIQTSDYILPITSNLTINFVSGTGTVTQNIELLPGVELTIGRNAGLTISSGKKIYVYDNDDWLNFSGSARMYPIGYSVANGTTAIRSEASLKDAEIDVNGTLTVAGALFTSNGGANIKSSLGTEGTQGKIVFSTAPTASSTIYETNNNSDKTSVSFCAPRLHNGDDSYSDTTGTGTSTWYYDKDGEHWYRFKVNFVCNGGAVGTGYFCENGSSVTYDASWITGLGASVTSGSASVSISGTNVVVTNVTSNCTVTLTGNAAKTTPVFLLDEKQYANYCAFTGGTLTETREIDGKTYYVVWKADQPMSVGASCPAPSDASMGVSAEAHNSAVWNLSGVSATSGSAYTGTVPPGGQNGESYIFGFYIGCVAYNSSTDKYYPTLAEAMADLPMAGECTVSLIADCGTFEDEDTQAAFPVFCTLTVELNGHKAVGRLVNKADLTLDLMGGAWEYATHAAAAEAGYQGMAAVTNAGGTLTVKDTVGGGVITADAVSNSGVPNHSAVIRNTAGGIMSISDVTLKNLQDVNGYVSVILNDRARVTAITNVTILSPRGYAIFNYGGTIDLVDSCTVDCAYGVYNRNVRGSNTIAQGYNIANYGLIAVIKDSDITVGQYAIHNGAVINELDNCTLTAHPDSAQVNTCGTTAVNVQGNVQCYTVYNSGNWWYDTNVWKRTDVTSGSYSRTDEYKEDISLRPTIGTIRDCRIYAENTSTNADHGCALYNTAGIINTICGNTVIKTYKHPDNPKSIASNFALRNTAGGVIHSITGDVEIRATGYGAFYNDGQFVAKTVNVYSDKIGGIQLRNNTTYGAPSLTETVNCTGVIAAGSYYGVMNSGRIDTITGGLTISANYNALLNSGSGALTSYEYVRTYTTNTDATTETKRAETYVRNWENASSIGLIDGVHFVGTGTNSYQLLQNQGYIGTLKDSDFTAASPRAGESYPMFLNGDSRQTGHSLTREPFAYGSYFITPYEYHYDYTPAIIGTIDNVTITKNATYAFRNLGRIDELKNSTITGTQYVFLNTATGPYVSREVVRYYSGAAKFSTTKNNGADLTLNYERNAASIGLIDSCTVTGTSTYAFYNGGVINTMTNNTISSTSTTVLYNGGTTVRTFQSNVLDIISEVTATDSACTVVYGNDAKVNTTTYDSPVIGLIGAGNHISGNYQVVVNLGEITAIDGGNDPVIITSTSQKQIGGVYTYAGTLSGRISTTPYTDGTAGTAVNEDTYYSAHIGSIKNTVITANGIGIQNGSANSAYLPTIDELGDGLEVNANCTSSGYHAVCNTTFAKIALISGGVYTAKTATANAYKNNNTVPEQATLITGGDFRGMANTRANAIFEPDNTDRQTYPEGKSLYGTESVTLHDGTTAEGYYFIGEQANITYTITWKMDDGTVIDTTTVAEGDTPTHAEPTKPATAQYTYAFAGWSPAIVPATENATYTATFTRTVNTYTVTWVIDGQTETQTYPYGAMPTHADPVKQGDAQYSYTFTGWSPEIAMVTGNATYTAQFEQTVNTYTVTWVIDGVETNETYPFGAVPTHADPVKQGDAQYSYTFTGWSPEIAMVTGNATYTAQFEQTVNTYTVTWVIDGQTETQTYPYGAVPTHADPVKEGDAQYSYTFTGWSPEIAMVTGNATYTAQFEQTVNTYTVTWVIDGQTETQTYPFGAVPTHADPVKQGDAQYSYTFTGWSPEIAMVTGNATYTAQFEQTVNTYTVTWVIDGVETNETYPFGATPTHADPVKEGYDFMGWDPEIVPVTCDTTYTAVFEEIVPEGWHIIVNDYTTGKATTSVVADQLYSGEVTFTVACTDDMACVVAIDNGDGTYTRLVCTTANGVHSFTVTVNADVNIVIAIKGDTNLNGKLETADSTLIKRAVANISQLSGVTAPIKKLAADVNGNGTLQTADSTMVLRAVARLYTIAW